MAQSATCASPVIMGTPLDLSVRLEGVASAESSPIPNGELPKHPPKFSPKSSAKSSTAVSLLSASSHLTPLPSAAAGVLSSPSPSPSAEDLVTPPLAHIAKEEEQEGHGDENEALPALLARVSRPPPFPFGGGELGNEDEQDDDDAQGEEQEQEQEQPEAAQSAADDDSSGSGIQEALSSLALADEA